MIDMCRSVADRFGVSTSTAWKCTINICNALVCLNQIRHIIRWPDGNHARQIAQAFRRNAGFPGKLFAPINEFFVFNMIKDPTTE
jgi:hypothetical protein